MTRSENTLCGSCHKSRRHYKNGLCAYCFEAIYVDSKKGLKKIDKDLVFELKMRGMYAKANELREAHYGDLKKVKKNELKDYNKKITSIKRVRGYCTYAFCKDAAINKRTLCQKHLDAKRKQAKLDYMRHGTKRKKYQSKIRHNKKLQEICLSCKNKAEKNRSQCESCLKRSRINFRKYYNAKKQI